MVIYPIVFIISILAFTLTINNSLNKKPSLVLLITLILFTGLTYTNGWDWYGYKDFYENIQSAGFSGVEDYNGYGIEYLYLVYMYLVGLTGLGFGFFVFINAFIVNIFIYKFCIRTAINYGLFMLLFISVSYLRLELSTIRQGMAVAIILYAYSQLLSESNKKALFYILLAICFHRSAAIVLFFLPFIKYVNKKTIHYFIVLMALPFIFLSDSINNFFIVLLNYANHGFLSVYALKLMLYLSMNKVAQVNPQAIMLIFLYLVCIYYCDFKDKKQLFFLNVMACQVIISLYFTFLTQLIIMRMVYYFQAGWMCWIIFLYKEYCRPKWLCFILIVCLITIKMSLNFRYEYDRAVFFPYYNVIFSFTDDEYGRSRDYILNKANEVPQG